MFLASLNVCKWRTRSARWSLHRMGQRSSGATAWFVNCRFRSSRPVGAAFVAINDLENMPVKTWLIWPEPLHQSAVSTTGRLLQVRQVTDRPVPASSFFTESVFDEVRQSRSP